MTAADGILCNISTLLADFPPFKTLLIMYNAYMYAMINRLRIFGAAYEAAVLLYNMNLFLAIFAP